MSVLTLLSASVATDKAWTARFADSDAVDVWRLLEAAYAAGHTAADWPEVSEAREAAAVLRMMFGRPDAAGARKASGRSRDQERVRALTLRVVPTA